MPYFRRHRRPLTWIALVALWAMALLPAAALAGAVARGGAEPGILLCTAQGFKRVAQEPASGPAHPAATASHCALCLLPGLDLAPPPAGAAAPAVPVVAIARAPARPTPAARPGGAAHLPRGPPTTTA